MRGHLARASVGQRGMENGLQWTLYQVAMNCCPPLIANCRHRQF
jgi:hypothetical protein